MRTRSVCAALALVLLPGGWAFGADRPTVKMATVTQEIATWCLPSGFMYDPTFAAAPPPADFERTFLSPAQALVALESGDVALDECVGLGQVAQAYAKGAHEAVIVAVTSTLPIYQVIGGKGLKTLADLKGRSVGSNGPTTTATTALVSVLQKGAGLVPDRDYAFVAVGTAGARTAALAAGKIDAIAGYPPYAYKLVDDGFPMLGAEKQYVPPYVQGTLVVNRDWAQANRPLLVAILKTMLVTDRWLRDPAKKADVIAKMADDITMGDGKLGPDLAKRVYADVVAANGGVVDGLAVDRGLFASTLALLADRGVLAKGDPPSIDRMVDYSYLNQARRELHLPEVTL
jgi:ABC-type nitrate/sulfonate/bicarbonate transport system substrate-binding protein